MSKNTENTEILNEKEYDNSNNHNGFGKGLVNFINKDNEEHVVKNTTGVKNTTVKNTTGGNSNVVKNTTGVKNTTDQMQQKDKAVVKNNTDVKNTTDKNEAVVKNNVPDNTTVVNNTTADNISNSPDFNTLTPQDIEKNILYLALISDLTNFIRNHTHIESYTVKKEGKNMQKEKKVKLSGNLLSLALFFLHNDPISTLSIREISKATTLNTKTVTNGLKRLEELGIISKDYNTESRIYDGMTITLRPIIEQYILEYNLINLDSEQILEFLTTYCVVNNTFVVNLTTVSEITTTTPVLYCLNTLYNKQYNTNNKEKRKNQETKTPTKKETIDMPLYDELDKLLFAATLFGFKANELILEHRTKNNLKDFVKDVEKKVKNQDYNILHYYKQLYYAIKQLLKKKKNKEEVTTKWGYFFSIKDVDTGKVSTEKNAKEIKRIVDFLYDKKTYQTMINEYKTYGDKKNASKDKIKSHLKDAYIQDLFSENNSKNLIQLIQKYFFGSKNMNLPETSERLSEMIPESFDEYVEVNKKLRDTFKPKTQLKKSF